jgi:hypothetical protein
MHTIHVINKKDAIEMKAISEGELVSKTSVNSPDFNK